MQMSELEGNSRGWSLGWGFSFLLHGGLIVCSFLFVQQVRLAPQPEPFTWNVALVSTEKPLVEEEAPTPLPTHKPASSKRSTEPAAVTPASPIPIEQKKHDVVPSQAPPPMQHAALAPDPTTVSPPSPKLSKPAPTPPLVPQVQAPDPAPPSPSSTMETRLEPEPVRSAPAPAIEHTRPTEAPVNSPPQEIVPEPVEPATSANTSEPLLQARTEENDRKSVAQEPNPLPSAVRSDQSLSTAATETPPTIARQEVGPPPQTLSASPSPTHTPSPPTTRETHKPREQNPIAPAQPEPPPIAPAPPQAQTAALSPPQAPVRSRPDYRWLSEMLVQRIEELKRYPADARLERAEGKVVVKVVIREDGTVGGAEVVKSSGFQSLDIAAVELMRQAGPFDFPHPLGKPSLTIKVPISYTLERR